MRILLVGDYPNDPRLGSSKVLYKLQDEFRRLGHHCDLVLADELGHRPSGGRARHVAGPLLAVRAVRRLARERGPYDVIDIASGEGALFGMARRAGWLGGSAFISRSNGLEHLNYRRMVDDHDAGLLRKPWVRRIWYPAVRLNQVALAARSADRLLLLNEQDRAFALAQRWKTTDRIDVVPHGVTSRFLEAHPATGTRGAGILFCGSWDHMKGIAYLAKAFEQLHRSYRPARLTVLGSGARREDVLAAFHPSVRESVTVVDRVPEEQVMAEYRRHDLLMLASTYEGFGMVVLEAMSQRLPVVATPVGCATLLVRDGETGLLVPPRDAAALASAANRLLEAPAFAASLAERAYAEVRDMTWTEAARATIAAYERARAAVGARARLAESRP